MPQTHTSWCMLVLAIALSGCRAGQASQGAVGDAPDPPPRAAVVPGELILKLAPEAGEPLEAALAAHRALTQTGLVWLDTLNARYGVTTIEPLFAHHPDLEAIKRKYPQRTKRAPPGAQVPSLKHIYKLTLQKDADVLQAVADYHAQPEVEYAQPNYLATIQGKGAAQ